MKRFGFLIVVLLVIVLLNAGCRRRPNRGTVPTSVTITYKGAPVNEAVIVFVGPDGKYANGLTNPKGFAKMMTFEPGDGVIPGDYKVAVDKSELVEKLDPNKPGGENVISSKTVFHIPKKFSNILSSSLNVTVAPKGPNDFVFDLND